MLKPTKILVPTDFSEYSDQALRQALDIGKEYGATVYLLHVIHERIPIGAIEFPLSYEIDAQLRVQVAEDARRNLAAQAAKFPQAKEVGLTTDVKYGTPYMTILEEERERGIDLIVIASLGRSGIAKFLIGSVARNVLKGAKCPVLLTK